MIRAGPASRAAAAGPGLRAGSRPLEGKGDGPDGWGHGEGLARGRGPHAARCQSRLRDWKTLVCPHLSICSLGLSAEALPPSPRRMGGPRAGAEARGSEAPGASEQHCREHGRRPMALPRGSPPSLCPPGPRARMGFLLGAEGYSRAWRAHGLSLHPGDTRLPPRLLDMDEGSGVLSEACSQPFG